MSNFQYFIRSIQKNGNDGKIFEKFCKIFLQTDSYWKNVINDIYNYWPLFIMVLMGGQIGNFMNLKILSNRLLVIITSGLVMFVAIRIGLRIYS